MATYREIQQYVKHKHGITVRTCWIADIKEEHGLTRGPAHNRGKSGKSYPCPPRFRPLIEDALRHFDYMRSYPPLLVSGRSHRQGANSLGPFLKALLCLRLT